MIIRILKLIAFSLCCATPAFALDPTTHRYGHGDTAEGPLPLLLDYYRAAPGCETPRPTVLLIHGGGFRSGKRDALAWRRIAQVSNDIGFNAASISYRLMGDNPVPQLALGQDLDAPKEQIRAANAAFEDAARAMRWLVLNAKPLCVDPNKIAIWGDSAGAVTALFVGYALDSTGKTTGVKRPNPMAIVSFWGGYLPPEELTYGEPPLFLLHGTKDDIIPVAHSMRLAKTAQKEKIPVILHRVRGAKHGFKELDPFALNMKDRVVAEYVFEFLHKAAQGAPIPSRNYTSDR